MAERLPSKVLGNIFIRLPTQTIAATIAHVCRSWRSVVLDPVFCRAHLSLAISEGTDAFLLRKRQYDSRTTDLIMVSLEDREEPPSDVPNEEIEKRKGKKVKPYFEVSTICSDFFSSIILIEDTYNGLVLLACETKHHRPVYVCNPLMRECVSLPPTASPFPLSSTYSSYLGLDPIREEYKVLRMKYTQKEHNGVQRFSMESSICSIGANGVSPWRSISDVKCLIRLRSPCVIVNGNAHWVTDIYRGRDLLTGNICSFDLHEESFGELEVPNCDNEKSVSSRYQLCSFRGCLCLSRRRVEESFEIWVMKEYGEVDSWMMAYVIPIPSASYKGFGVISSFLWTTKGCILLRDTTLVFSDGHQIVRQFEIPWGFYIDHRNSRYFCNDTHLVPYIPSLVSLKSIIRGEESLGMTKIGNTRKRKQKINSWTHLNKEFISVSCPFCRDCCPTFTSQSKKNFGRSYYKCQRDDCTFFLWWDHVYRSVLEEQTEAEIDVEKDLLRKDNAELTEEIKRLEGICMELQKKLDLKRG